MTVSAQPRVPRRPLRTPPGGTALPPRRRARTLAAIATASYAAILLTYVLHVSLPGAHPLVVALAGTWAAGYALGCSLLARRHATDLARQGWGWIASACALTLAAQLGAVITALRGATPSYPGLGDILSPALFLCLALGMRSLMPVQSRRPEPDVGLDAGLVTFTAVALGYVFILVPLLRAPFLPSLLSILAAVAAIAILWLIARQMVQWRSFPAGGARLVTAGIVLMCIAGALHVRDAVHGILPAGDVWDLTWDGGLLLVAIAAAFVPEGGIGSGAAIGGLSGQAARIIAVLVAIAGIAGLAFANALHADVSAATTPWVIVGVTIIGVRFVYALRADRRYAELLEREVAAQTRSLMDSLAATAAAERNLRLVMESVPEALFVLDRDGRVSDMNAAARTLPTATKSDAGAIFDILDREVTPTLRHHLDAAFRGEVRRFEVYSPRPDTTRGVHAVLYAPIRDGWRVSRVLASVRDITDLKRTESQLQQAEKLAAMGQLVSGVAHEINNPAAIISGFAQTLLLDELKTEQREMAQMIYDEATRIGRITQNLLAFARAGGKERTLVDLNDILRRTFALRSYHLSTLNIAIELELDPSDPKIWANASEVQQMLLNLMINAEQALMTVESARKIRIRSVSTEQEVQFEVSDNGPGVAPDVRARVFDPFFTTKPEGVGTGLGLSICYGIVQEHGGRISLESELGQGATFAVALPRDPRAEVRTPEEAPAATGDRDRRITVLLLDDETNLGQALLRFLGRRGIDATLVADGGEALRVLRRQEFDVIVSDVRMPGMSGRDFLAHLRRERPELVSRLIFSTGDACAPDTAELLASAAIPTVSKPFDFATLEQIVRNIAAQQQV